MTRPPRHRNRLIAKRPRTSTLVLIGLFLGFLALYVLVRPATASNTGNVRQLNPAPTQAPSTPAYTPTPRHSTLSPTPTHSPAQSVTPTPHATHTPTPATSPSTSVGTTGTPTPTASATSTSPALLPAGSPVR